ncbi:hypothetical protein B9Z55_007877 [Caenorhabditis nigoni]|uniref:BTB domain-containing protein n=1 Tax=Caenorhabditis nigoni TaxID=1611254 RepID=A0A2G5VBR0_9PELO|nr:hypothetical protein B9Z55_007877 [Caenorhabditis nigoni]
MADSSKREHDYDEDNLLAPVKRKKVSYRRVDDESNDVILNVQGVKFYVRKDQLIESSTVFNTMLTGPWKESGEKELVISDFSADDIQLLLRVLNAEKCLNDNNIKRALQMLDFYGCLDALKYCQQWLLNESKMETSKKLELALKLNLDSLKPLLVVNCDTIVDIAKILPEDGVDNLDELSAKLLLLQTMSLFGLRNKEATPGEEAVGIIDQKIMKLKEQMKVCQEKLEFFQKKKAENMKLESTVSKLQRECDMLTKDIERRTEQIEHVAEDQRQVLINYRAISMRDLEKKQERLNKLKEHMANTIII